MSAEQTQLLIQLAAGSASRTAVVIDSAKSRRRNKLVLRKIGVLFIGAVSTGKRWLSPFQNNDAQLNNSPTAAPMLFTPQKSKVSVVDLSGRKFIR